MQNLLMILSNIFLFYLFIINIFGFVSMGIDKFRAKRNTPRKPVRRIPEKTLFLIALIGGSLGSIIGMWSFHHKTRHWYFRYGMPLILIIQLGIVTYVYNFIK